MSNEEKKLPRWLEKDGVRQLYAGEDIEAACIHGWKEPEGVRGNGQPWNPEPVEGETPQLVHVAEVAKANAVVKSKRDDKAEKERAAKEKEAEKARADAPVTADFKVEVVTPTKAKK